MIFPYNFRPNSPNSPQAAPLRRLLRQAPQRRRGEDVAGRLHEPRTVLLTRWAPGVADEDALGGLGTWEGMGKPRFPKVQRRFIVVPRRP